MARQSRTTTSNDVNVLLIRIVFLLTVLALVLFGLVMVFSAGTMETVEDEVGPFYFLRKQLIAVAIGVVLAVILWKVIPSSWFNTQFVAIAVVVIVALFILLTRFAGDEVNGARRWILIAGFSFQISEFAKIAFAIMGAYILDHYRSGEFSFKEAAVWAFVGIIIPMGFLYVFQSDLGTTLIIGVGLLSVLWIGEVPTKWFAIIVLGLVIFALFAVFGTGYRSNRFNILSDPWNDGEGGYGAGYQLIHSYYALAEGGVTGVGLGNSHEKFQYLPEAETDFIFAVIGEELGLIGATLVIVMFLVFLWAGMRICRSAATGFDAMLSGSLVIMIVAQAFLNISCVIGLLPTTGKPLPFISSGGSSMIATLIMVGLILGVSEASDKSKVYEKRRDDLRVIRAN
ncbi:MAG: putative peptidoglycan glycosyltransferase FtsW [Eggerthellaceae bacterium]|nr:putative peptidoglycan glycosyltransferase FtsW [Eggerthellaceae bacterium]